MTPPAIPPLTSVESFPLHGWDYDTDYACQRPEDPHCMAYDWRCPACLLAAQAHLANFGDEEVAWQQSGEHEEQIVLLSWLIARSIWWQDKLAEEDA